MFSTLHHLPFPMKKLGDEKFKHFDKEYGEIASEGNRPGLIEKEKSSHHMPFSPSSQSAKNTGTVVQCDECGNWRCVYSERKLKKDVSSLLEWFNEEFNYTCGVVLQELILYDTKYSKIQELMFVKANLTCRTEIEIPFYSSCNDPICIYCGCDDKGSLVEEEGKYPICNACVTKNFLPKDKRTRVVNKTQKSKDKKLVGQSVLNFTKT